MTITTKEQAQQIKDELNDQLSKVTNFKELNALLDKFSKMLDTHGYIELVGIRRKIYAFDFRETDNPEKVSYLYDDEISKGLSKYKNLRKALTFQVWYSHGVV